MASTYHKLVDGRHSRWIGDKKTGHREHYNFQDPENNLIPDLSDDEIEMLGARVIEVDPSKVKRKLPESTSTSVPPVTNGHAELLAKTVPQIEEEVNKITDISVLDSIRQQEISGQQRMGVLKVLKARKEALEAEK